MLNSLVRSQYKIFQHLAATDNSQFVLTTSASQTYSQVLDAVVDVDSSVLDDLHEAWRLSWPHQMPRGVPRYCGFSSADTWLVLTKSLVFELLNQKGFWCFLQELLSDVEELLVALRREQVLRLHEPRLLSQAFVWNCFKLLADLQSHQVTKKRPKISEANEIGVHNVHPELVHFVWEIFGIEPVSFWFTKFLLPVASVINGTVIACICQLRQKQFGTSCHISQNTDLVVTLWSWLRTKRA